MHSRGGIVRRPAESVAQFLVCFVIIALAAYATRLVSLGIGVAFNVHGALVAPLYSVIGSASVRLTGRFWPVGTAVLALSGLLGLMHPVMALSNGIPAIVSLVANALMATTSRPQQTSAPLAPWLLGALVFPSGELVGLLAGMYAVTQARQILVIALLTVLTATLSYGGTLLVSSVKPESPEPHGAKAL